MQKQFFGRIESAIGVWPRWGRAFARGVLCAGVAVSACSSEVGLDPRGQVLFRLSAQVDVDAVAAAGELQPGIVFVRESATDLQVHFLSAYALGAFPEEFVLAVYDVPPDGVLMRVRPSEPLLSTGLIAALSPGHPDGIALSQGQDGGLDVGAFASAVERYIYREIGGVAPDVRLVYLADFAAPETLTAALYGNGQALSPGFHLVRRRDPTSEERDRTERCWEEAWRAAEERYVRAHPAFVPGIETGWCRTEGAAECPQEVFLEVHRLVEDEVQLNGCAAEFGWEPVDPRSSTRVVIGAGFSELP